MQKKNKLFCGSAGMTLIEMVVAVLIIGVVAATSFVGVAQVNRMDAAGAAGKIESSLALTRIQTIAATADSDVKFKLGKDSNGYYGSLTKKSGTSDVEIEHIEIGASSLSIKVYNGGSATTVSSGTEVSFNFKKANGSFDSEYDKIVVSGSKTKNVILVKETGRCYVE